MRSIELFGRSGPRRLPKAAGLRGLEVLRYRAIKRSMIAPTVRHSFSGRLVLAFGVLKRLARNSRASSRIGSVVQRPFAVSADIARRGPSSFISMHKIVV